MLDINEEDAIDVHDCRLQPMLTAEVFINAKSRAPALPR
jgi:hypothetical protein